jgi:hypothetical protein
MYKFFIIIVAIAVFSSCSQHKTNETVTPASDTLMDSTTIKLKADTTVKMIDHLGDSLSKLRENAADQQ